MAPGFKYGTKRDLMTIRDVSQRTNNFVIYSHLRIKIKQCANLDLSMIICTADVAHSCDSLVNVVLVSRCGLYLEPAVSSTERSRLSQSWLTLSPRITPIKDTLNCLYPQRNKTLSYQRWNMFEHCMVKYQTSTLVFLDSAY